ncbi:hypothetical protein CH294_17725 [Rhodococcus sp. 14-2483-1-1]|uniref:DUF6992 family protein n=1 Tax=Rhodococcus sp. 14-2483-1-1 TaxID=2023148 RepID=UPI000B9A57A3|nr:hypothetical protein [Rhodococcus sp. 14-2483-1-1]OZF32979.1 hypothetical protein CH294_17725 [Rhodococcus sp. 14-2483-1-1]
MTPIEAPIVAERLGRRLTVWGGGSVLAGTVLALRGSSPARRAFGLQTAGWGAIDLAIASAGALSSKPPTSASLSRLLWINAGLDVLYIATGAHIAVRKPRFGRRITADQALGHGTAVVVQGVALLVLDTTHARMISG